MRGREDVALADELARAVVRGWEHELAEGAVRVHVPVEERPLVLGVHVQPPPVRVHLCLRLRLRLVRPRAPLLLPAALGAESGWVGG